MTVDEWGVFNPLKQFYKGIYSVNLIDFFLTAFEKGWGSGLKFFPWFLYTFLRAVSYYCL